MSRVLGIETSCDETGVAVIEGGRRVLINEVASQIDVHKEFGGVVPEIASRQHTGVISQLARRALEVAGGNVDAVAATNGPGLMGSLLVGVCFGKALAYARNVPFIPVHHIEGHIFSAFLAEPAPAFPFLALVVSGGHTQIIAWLQVALQLDPETPVKDLAEVVGHCQSLAEIAALQSGRHSTFGTSGQADQAGGVLGQGGQGQAGSSLLSGQLTGAEQATQIGVAALGFYQEEEVAVIVKRHLRAKERPYAGVARCGPETDRSVQTVVVCERQRAVTERRGTLDQSLGGGGSIEQRIVAMAMQFGIVGEGHPVFPENQRLARLSRA